MSFFKNTLCGEIGINACMVPVFEKMEEAFGAYVAKGQNAKSEYWGYGQILKKTLIGRKH